MSNKYIEYFIDNFGQAIASVAVPDESIKKWEGLLPATLIELWKNEGWGSYRNGLISFVNPDEYDDVLDLWLEDTQLEEEDSYHVIAKTAFGSLYIFGESTGMRLIINPLYNQIVCFSDTKRSELNEEIESFLGFGEPEDYDWEDDNGNYFFEKAIAKFGPLGQHEMFAFEPAYVLGGQLKFNDLNKVDCRVHLILLRELSSPHIVNF
ncbi:TPA: DUF1851 domain-containing protein [Salmonella enterica]|nr:DUF1851 domain-containing protein [Salmonella enterica]